MFIALTRSLGEVGVSLMLGGDILGRTDTLSLAVYNAVLDGENDKAWVLCTLLTGISLLLFSLGAIIAKRG
ncbi:hypothetical protein [Campylobacter sp. 19-13652]|uniref:hypothetical protein n=1 Tax=Campylobacter sp. 19-13652 TaxID=2840180 RepID=UPI001C77CB1E|nr:hypothetical protein [Campylobacter sp. 19-13652]BCX78595.1 hypothetical protein LBC_00570 [Campylobacter sp. 19-13652]